MIFVFSLWRTWPGHVGVVGFLGGGRGLLGVSGRWGEGRAVPWNKRPGIADGVHCYGASGGGHLPRWRKGSPARRLSDFSSAAAEQTAGGRGATGPSSDQGAHFHTMTPGRLAPLPSSRSLNKQTFNVKSWVL